MITFAQGTSKEFISQFRTAIQYLKTNNLGENILRLERSKVVYKIAEGKSGQGSDFNTKTKTITWCPTDGLHIPETGITLSPTTALNHEFGHVNNYNKAILNSETAKQFFKDCKNDLHNPYGSKEEERVITGIEQKTARALGEIKDGEIARTSHIGVFYNTESVTSTKPKVEN
jgi:hypothetical protein